MLDNIANERWDGTLGDLIYEAVDKVDPQLLTDRSIPYIGLEHIEQATGRLSSVGRASDVVSQKSAFKAGDVLYGKLRPSLRKVARPNFAGVCSTDIIVLRAKKGSDADYAFQFLLSDQLTAHAISTAAGTKMPRTHPKLLLKLAIQIPPLDEQRRIAEVLRSVDGAVAAQVEVCRHLARTFNYLAEASFVQPHGQVSGAWTVLPMGEICESIQVGIVVRPASYYVSNGGIPALRSLNIGENYLNLDDIVYISEEGHRLNGKSSLGAGDIVTRRTGEPGKTAMIPACFPDGLNCIDIIFSRPKAIVRAEFVSFFMNSEAAKKQVIALQGGLAQQHLNVTEMKTLKVPVPPLDVQDEIITALRAAMANLERERALIDQWSRLQAALMSDLLSGRVRVPA